MSLAIFDFINTAFLPEYCITCNKSGSYICKNCLRTKYKVNFRTVCHVCGRNSFKFCLHKDCRDYSNLDNLYFFCEYNSAAKELIEVIKYHGNYSILNSLSWHMANYLKIVCPEYKKFKFTYVPSHWTKQNSRGFNQSQLLAKSIAKLLGVELCDVLQKNQATNKQAGTNRSQRSKNLKGKFTLKKVLVPENVMIVDDVHTTGATLNECASLLKLNGARTVYGYAFSKSLNYSQNTIE